MNQFAAIAVEINALNKIYFTRAGPPVKAIDNLTLSIPGGQVFGILGASSAGKTTLVKIMGGMVIPTSGEVRLNGYNLRQEYNLAVQQVGVALEGTQEVNSHLSVWENLKRVGRVKGCSEEMLKQHAKQLLHKLDLSNAWHSPMHELSRGQRRKVAFMSALLADPPITVFDEPLSGFDAKATETVKIWLKRLAHEQGKTVVLTSRHPDVAQELCDQVAIIHKGQLAVVLSTSELLKSAQPVFQIKVKGHLAHHWREWFDNLDMIHTDGGETIITGPVVDQAALHGLIIRIRDLGLPLFSVTQVEPSLKEMLAQVTAGQ